MHVHHLRGLVGPPGVASGGSVLSDIHILDDDGRPCPVGTSGTVWFAGATDFEYFNDPDKTAGVPAGRRDDVARWATWATWTQTATCS